MYLIGAKKKVENSEIGPDSETLTSNIREPVDFSFNKLSFIQGLGEEVPVRDVGHKVTYENGVGDFELGEL